MNNNKILNIYNTICNYLYSNLNLPFTVIFVRKNHKEFGYTFIGAKFFLRSLKQGINSRSSNFIQNCIIKILFSYSYRFKDKSCLKFKHIAYEKQYCHNSK